MIGHSFSFGFNLISLLLRQLEESIRNSQIANPDFLHISGAILRAKPPESAFDKVHRAARPVIGAANSQPQQAHSQNCGRPFIPSRAVTPSNSLEPGEGDVLRQPDHTSGGSTVPAGGKYRSPISPPS